VGSVNCDGRVDTKGTGAPITGAVGAGRGAIVGYP